MINNIDTWMMLNELHCANVTMEINPEWSDEEFHNYIVNLYDIFLMPAPWESAAKAAEMVYMGRKWRKQEWRKAFKPGAWR